MTLTEDKEKEQKNNGPAPQQQPGVTAGDDRKQQAKKGKGTFEFPDGGWECSNCQNYNFKGRKECFRCKKARSKKDLTGKPKHMLKNEQKETNTATKQQKPK